MVEGQIQKVYAYMKFRLKLMAPKNIKELKEVVISMKFSVFL